LARLIDLGPGRGRSRGRTGPFVEEGHLAEEVVRRIHGLEHGLAVLELFGELDGALEEDVHVVADLALREDPFARVV
jgi:hypothetical protein